MQYFTTWLGNKRSKPGRAGGANLWRQWVQQPRAMHWLLRDEDMLNPKDVSLVEHWADMQVEWGLHVRLHVGPSGLPQVVEVFGPDLTEPHVLLYRVDNEVQIDEAHGESRRCTGMTEALDYVASYT